MTTKNIKINFLTKNQYKKYWFFFGEGLGVGGGGGGEAVRRGDHGAFSH